MKYPAYCLWKFLLRGLVLGAAVATATAAQTAYEFSWTQSPSTATVNIPFPAALRALESSGQLAGDFNGPVLLAGWESVVKPSVLISEVAGRAPRSVELCNVSDFAVNVSEWRISFYDSSAWPAPVTTFTLPSVVCPPRGVFQIQPGGLPPGEYPTFNLGIGLGWASEQSASVIAVLVQNRSGELVDFFCACSGYPQLIESPVAVPAGQWVGLPAAPNPTSSRSYQRIGGRDGNHASDWVAAPATLGRTNTLLRFPFAAGERRVRINPEVVQLTQGQWAGLLSVTEAARSIKLRADDGVGVVGDSATLYVLAGPPLFLELPPGGNEATPGLLGLGRASVATPLSTNLVVALEATPHGELALPASVVIPAGASFAEFSITNLDDAVLDGDRIVTVTAFAQGWESAAGTLTNVDNEVGQLTLRLPATVGEGDATFTGRVDIHPAVGRDFEIFLRSLSNGDILPPTKVYIGAGSTSATFVVTIINNTNLNGTQTAQIEAQAAGALGAIASVQIADDEVPRLFLDVYTPVEEARGMVSNAVRVSAGGRVLTNVLVSLTSRNPGRLEVPATVLLPSGANSVSTYFNVPDDPFTNALALVEITAAAPGFLSGTNYCAVRDDDVHHFYWPPQVVGPRTSGRLAPTTIYAHTIDGYVPSRYSGTATLRAVSPSGELVASPSQITFSEGAWMGDVVVRGEGRGTVLIVDDGLGHVGTSEPFDVADATFGLRVSGLVYDVSRTQIVAGVVSQGGTYSNNVVGLDPETGSVLWALPLGSEPNRLALSDDYSMLYVSDNSTGGLARVNLATRTVGLRFPLGFEAGFGAYFAEDMEVMPGNPRSIAVSRKVSFGAYNRGVAIYDNEGMRPSVVGPGSFASGYPIAFYGYSNRLYRVSQEGLNIIDIRPDGVAAVGGRSFKSDFKYDGGLLYGNDGTVLWADTLRMAGTFPASGFVCPDPAAGRIYFMEGNQLRAFNLNTYAEIGPLNFDFNPGNPLDIVRCGGNRLAFRSSDDRLVILRTALIPSPSAADLSVRVSTDLVTPTVGEPIVYTIVATNAGPVLVSNVVVATRLPLRTALIGAQSSQGLCYETNGLVICEVGGMPSGSFATIMITARVDAPGDLVNTVRVIGGSLDPSNDVAAVTNVASFGAVLPPVTVIDLDAEDLAYESRSNRLWASVGLYQGRGTNHLRGIALSGPYTNRVYPLTATASRLHCTADGSFVYAVLPNALRRIATANGGAIQFPAGGIADLEALPNAPSSIALATGPVFVYDGSVPRAVHDGDCGSIEFTEQPSRLLGVDSEGGLYEFAVQNSGVNQVGYTGGVINRRTGFRYMNGRFYCTDGLVVDRATFTRLATLPVSSWLATDPATSEVAYLIQDYPRYILTGFSASSLAPTWAYTIPGVSNLAGNLVRCGPGIYAFRTVESQVVIVNTANLPRTPAADLETSFDPPMSAGPVGSPFTIVGIVRNHGPAPAMNVVVSNTFSSGTVLQAFSTAHGTCTNVNGELICSLGHLAPGGAASFVLTVSKTNAGVLTVLAHGASDQPDPISTNSVGLFTANITGIGPPPPPEDPPLPTDLSVRELFTLAPPGHVTYHLIVSNAGPAVVTNVTLIDIYPAGSTVISAEARNGDVRLGVDHVEITADAINLGSTLVASLVVEPPPGATWMNRAYVYSNAADLNAVDNYAISVIGPGGANLVTEVRLPVRDIVYDDVRRRLYASVLPSGGVLSNSVVAIDPDSGEVVQHIEVGEPIGRLAVSAEGRYIYAALTETNAVVRLDPVAGQIDGRIALAEGRYAFDLAPFPTEPLSLAVSSRSFPLGFDPGVEVYDGAVPRANHVMVDAIWSSFFLEVASPPDRIYASGSGGFHVLPLSLAGVTYSPVEPRVPPVATDFVVAAGRAYFQNGEVVNLSEPPMSVDHFDFSPGFVAPDIDLKRIYFMPLDAFPSSFPIQSYDLITHSNLWALSLSMPPGTASELTRLRPGELAFFTEGDYARVVLVRTGPLETPAANMALATAALPSPIAVGGVISYSLSVQNLGGWNVTNVIVTNALPSGATFVSATTSQGACSFTNEIVSCLLGAMDANSSASLSIVVRANEPGILTNQFGVTSPFVDPNVADNSLTMTTVVYPPPTLSIGDAAVREGSGRTSILFRVTLSTISSRPVTARYATIDGTARAGVDYDSFGGLLVFPPNTTNAIITTLQGIRGNSTVSSNRYFYIQLTNPTNAVFGRDRARGWILEDDFNWVSVASTNIIERNVGRSDAVFNLTLAAPSPQSVSIDYRVIDGTATAGTDYSPRAGTFIFSPGTTNGIFRVPVWGDYCVEEDETLFAVLSPTESGAPQVAEAAATILNDDVAQTLSIVAFEPIAAGWRVTFPTTCDRSYRLQRSETLDGQSWTIVSDVIPGNGQLAQVDDRTFPARRQAFYRVEELP